MPTKVGKGLVKAMVFPVVMYGCESWTVKKAERRRIDAFELWCWRRPLRVSWTTRRYNQSILKEIRPGISLEGMMLKLKLQYFGHLMQRVGHNSNLAVATARLVITFLPRSKHLLILWLQSPSTVILEPPQNKVCHCFHCFPIYFP